MEKTVEEMIFLFSLPVIIDCDRQLCLRSFLPNWSILFRSGPHLPPFTLQPSHTLFSPLSSHDVNDTKASVQVPM